MRNVVSSVKFLKEPDAKFHVLTPNEENRYLMACSQPLQDAAIIMLDCGCRPDEVYKLRLFDVNIKEGYLYIPNGKTKAARRRIPLTERALSVIEKRIAEAKKANSEFLFASERMGKTKPIVKLNNAHYSALTRAVLPKFRIYDLRHTYASRLAMAGVDLVTLAALLGHSRVQMVMRYAHPIEQHKIDAIRKLEAYNKAAKIG
jgi:integrase